MSASNRRAYGTGTLETIRNKQGREVYYGRFHSGGRQVKRKLGVKRRVGETTGCRRRRPNARCRSSSRRTRVWCLWLSVWI